MRPMALWQRLIYGTGEAMLLAGVLWGLYRALVQKTCPVGPFNDFTLVVIGLTVAVLPLHPFGRPAAGPPVAAANAAAADAATPPAYLIPALRKAPALAAVIWLLAVAGTGYSLWARFTLQPGSWWFAALLPAALYFWFGITTARKPVPAAASPAQPRRGGRDA